MAINREQIAKKILDGSVTPAFDFTSPVIDGWTEDIPGNEVLDYNPEEAKKLWEKANEISPWSGTFQIAYNADAAHQPWVDAVSHSVNNVLGIEASGVPVPTFAEFQEQVSSRKIQTPFRSGWQADYPGLYNFLGPLYATNASANYGDYSNPEFDKLLKEGASAKSQEKAVEAYTKAQSILLDDLPVIPLWYSNMRGAWTKDISNVEFGWNSVPVFYQITKE